jgi:hypothetical protein
VVGCRCVCAGVGRVRGGCTALSNGSAGVLMCAAVVLEVVRVWEVARHGSGDGGNGSRSSTS